MMDVSGKRVFISGPVSGRPDGNRWAFDAAEEKILAYGASDVINPTRDLRAAFGSWLDGMTHEQCMAVTIHWLTEFWGVPPSPRVDIMVQLDGWEEAQGCMAELLVARECGIEVVKFRDMFKESHDN